MITLITLLCFTTVLGLSLVYSIIRFSVWKNRALIIIIISALYFLTIFIIFSYHGGVLE
jgi:hypothetical protein